MILAVTFVAPITEFGAEIKSIQCVAVPFRLILFRVSKSILPPLPRPLFAFLRIAHASCSLSFPQGPCASSVIKISWRAAAPQNPYNPRMVAATSVNFRLFWALASPDDFPWRGSAAIRTQRIGARDARRE